MFDQLSAEILASLIKGFPRTTTRTTTTTTRTTTTTKQNVDPAVYYIYSRVKMFKNRYYSRPKSCSVELFCATVAVYRICFEMTTGLIMCSVSNPVYTDTGIPVFGTPNTDTDTVKNFPVFAGIENV
jgi:hypothetical protein